MLVLRALTAMAVATVCVWMELLSSRYSHTFALIKKSRALWAYPLIYGALAFGAVLGFQASPNANALHRGIGHGPSNGDDAGKNSPNGGGVDGTRRWLSAIAIGLCAKAFLHIRLFTVPLGSQPVPVGTETLVMLFEPWLLRKIELYEYNAIRDFIEPRAKLYHDLDDVKNRIKQRIPIRGKQDKSAFEVDVDLCPDVLTTMDLYLRMFGVETFNRAFPPRPWK